MNRGRAAGISVGLVAALVLGLVWWTGRSEEPASVPAPSAAPTSTHPTAEPRARPKQVGTRARLTPKGCVSRGAGRFTPTRVSVESVTRGAAALALPRDTRGVPGVAPVSGAGKHVFAWDAPGIVPGSPRGNVLLNAHTWPDGSALGNALLARLQEGEGLALYGEDGRRICYEVVDRVKVPFNAPTGRVYDETGPPKVVIVVCSGTRLGPGVWTHRTLWFASPVPSGSG